MKITIEFETAEQLASLLSLRDDERDSLIARVQELEATPLEFSLQGLARRVCEGMTSLTPSQESQITDLITK